jgi:DNA-binding CsgD family transcriptional regulator
VLNQQSRLVKIAGFGESVFDSIEEISAWDENPASKCILKKDQVFIGPDKGLGESPILAIPFIKQDVPVGCLAMAFSREFAESPVAASIVPAFSQLGAFFLENSLTNPITNLQKISTPEELTTRQIQILSYMGDGLTNSEIAAQVLLSESTVRQETIRIYRILSVKSRQDAVLAARSLGLIKPVRMQ